MNLTQLEFFFFPKESKEGSHGQLVLVVYKSNLGCSLPASNVCSAEKYTKRSSLQCITTALGILFCGTPFNLSSRFSLFLTALS